MYLTFDYPSCYVFTLYLSNSWVYFWNYFVYIGEKKKSFKIFPVLTDFGTHFWAAKLVLDDSSMSLTYLCSVRIAEMFFFSSKELTHSYKSALNDMEGFTLC